MEDRIKAAFNAEGLPFLRHSGRLIATTEQAAKDVVRLMLDDTTGTDTLVKFGPAYKLALRIMSYPGSTSMDDARDFWQAIQGALGE